MGTVDSDLIYFVAYDRGDPSRVRVVDLSCLVLWQRGDFSPVNDENYSDRDEAISVARALAEKYGLEYVRFESRYCSSSSEPAMKVLSL